MNMKSMWLGLLLIACGGRAAMENDNASDAQGGSTSTGGAGGSPAAAAGTSATDGGTTTITIDDGGTTVTIVPSDAGPDPITIPIHPGGPLGECDSVPCERGFTCVQPWSYNPGYHVCSFKCAKPESPNAIDPALKADCEIRSASCRLENPLDLQCIPLPPQTI